MIVTSQGSWPECTVVVHFGQPEGTAARRVLLSPQSWIDQTERGM
jgi:hypothetical protein